MQRHKSMRQTPQKERERDSKLTKIVEVFYSKKVFDVAIKDILGHVNTGTRSYALPFTR